MWIPVLVANQGPKKMALSSAGLSVGPVIGAPVPVGGPGTMDVNSVGKGRSLPVVNGAEGIRALRAAAAVDLRIFARPGFLVPSLATSRALFTIRSRRWAAVQLCFVGPRMAPAVRRRLLGGPRGG